MSHAAEPTIRISEIFGPTIQGEGPLIGLPTVFVRTGGCDFRCSWCDTLHAVDSDYRGQWQSMSVDQIWSEVTRLSYGQPLMISLSGGNPAIQPLDPLIKHGHDLGYRFALETQGSVAREWFADLHTPPSPEDHDAAIDLDGIMDRMIWLVEKVTKDRWYGARVLPQLHILLWGNKRGV